MIKIVDIQIDHVAKPNAVDNPHPRISWKFDSDLKNLIQKSYRVVFKNDQQVLYDSKIVESDEQFVIYNGIAFSSRDHIRFVVEATLSDAVQQYRLQSEEVTFDIGLLNKNDWQGKWIKGEDEVDRKARKKPLYFRKEFTINKKIKRAVIYQSAHGLYQSYINGKEVSSDRFNPGLTSYYYRIQYQRYDITSLLNSGDNCLAVIVTDGWWRGVTGGTVINNFGQYIGYLGQIEIEYADGSCQTIASDESFKVGHGPILASDMQMGEVFDSNLQSDWAECGFDEDDYVNATLLKEKIDGKLIASSSFPVKEQETFIGESFIDGKGDCIVDFHQNIAGTVSLLFRNTQKDQIIDMQFGEDLKDGTFYRENICHTPKKLEAFQQLRYICSGREAEEYKPTFVVFGFRYMKIEGYHQQIQPGDFKSIAIYSDLPYRSSFDCSDPLINQLVNNARWSQKGNYLDVATDCPTRERNAWTGDAMLYVNTACYFSDAYGFYLKWLKDQSIEQYDSGKVNFTFPATSSVHHEDSLDEARETSSTYELAGPNGNGNFAEDSVGWGDSAVIIPYVLYRMSGDQTILENQYETARKYINYQLKCAEEANPMYLDEDYYKHTTFDKEDYKYIYDTRFHYGEWNEYTGKEQASDNQEVSQEMVNRFLAYMAAKGNRVVATAYNEHSCRLLAEMAVLLNKKEDAIYYQKQADKIRFLYDKYLINEEGIIEQGHQAPYVRALRFNLVSENKKPAVIQQLIEEIEKAGCHLNTGFLSTPYLLPVLTEIGRTDLALKILFSKEVPGWLNPIIHGATTIPESWDGFKNHRNSLNHYSYGSVCEYLFSIIGGICPDSKVAGFKRFTIHPMIIDELSCQKTVFDSPYGMIVSQWEKKEGRILYTFSIPVNTTADIILQDGRQLILQSGDYTF